jgi:hypothetical protein
VIWVVDGRPVRLDGLGDLVDPAGAPAYGGEWVRLAHPAVDDFTPWRPWLARQGGLDAKDEPSQTITEISFESSAGELGGSAICRW